MSDLQCPATFHVLGPGASRPVADRLLDGAGVAAVHAGVGVHGAGVHAGDGESTHEPLDETRPLWDVLDELSDLYRGCHVLILPSTATPPLTSTDDAVTVRIDADGRTVEHAAPDPT